MSIPKVIHYCWFGGNPLPELAIKCIESWKKYCPDYEIKEWNEKNYDVNTIPYTKEAYEAKKWAFVSDVARLDVLYKEGGIYLDTDVELLQSLDKLLDCKGYMGFENKAEVASGLGMGAEPKSPVVEALLSDYIDIHFLLDDGSMDLTACPKRNTETLVKLGLIADGTYQELDGFKFYPRHIFSPKEDTSGKLKYKTSETISIHHYDGSWFTEQIRFTSDLVKKLMRFMPFRVASYTATLIGEIKYNGMKKSLTRVGVWIKKKIGK